MKYIFYDTDESGWAEYDIVGEDYIELMKICIKYSKSVSFRRFRYSISIPKHLEKYRLPLTENIAKSYRYYGELSDLAKAELYYLELSEDVCKWILSTTNSIWGWNHFSKDHLVEDPIFFREDGSVFADSIIHNGEFSIYPRDGEDVSSVVTKDHWHCFNDREHYKVMI
ncbi:MAG: hypothetical protein E7532_07100 [Ruminococcaceae bacterium]|nr:hypothetical protein [Oscillospiraceae bacterium]